MHPIIIDPRRRSIRLGPAVPNMATAVSLFMEKPYGVDNITSDHIFMWCPLSIFSSEAMFFWSKRMGDFYAGTALVFGTAVDGFPLDPEPGMETALNEDIIFLGDAEKARKTLAIFLAGGDLQL